MLIDHLLVAPPAYRTTWLEPITLLAALSGVTRTIQLGTLVLVLPVPRARRSSPSSGRRSTCCPAAGRSSASAWAGWRPSSRPLRIPHRERGARMNELLEADHRAVDAATTSRTRAASTASEDLTLEPKPAQRPHPPIWIGGGTQPSEKIYGQSVPTDPSRSCAGSRSTRRRGSPTPPRRPRWSTGDWDDLRALHGRVRAATRTRCRASTRTSCTSSGPASGPRTRRRCSASTRAWTSTTGRSSTCSARPRRSPTGSAARSRRSAASTTSILNPLDWDPANLERLATRRPAAGGGLIVAAGVTSALPPYLRPRPARRGARDPRVGAAAGRRGRRRTSTRRYATPPDRPTRPRHHGAAGPARRDRRRRRRWRIPALDDLDGPRRDAAAARVRRAAGGGPHDRRAPDPERAGPSCGNVVQRLAGGRRAAQPAGARRARSSSRRPLARGVVPIGGVRDSATGGRTCAPDELVTGLLRARSPTPATARAVDVPEARLAGVPRDLDRRWSPRSSWSTRRAWSSTRGSPSGRAPRSPQRLRGARGASSAGRRGRRRRSPTVPATEHLAGLAPIDDVRGTGRLPPGRGARRWSGARVDEVAA